MDVTATTFNSIPVFHVKARGDEPYRRFWGATRQADGWAFPGYYPFGAWAVRDMKKVVPGVRFDAAAQELLKRLGAADRLWTTANRQFAAKETVDLPLPEGFRFHLEPYNYQRFGIAKALAFWRLFVLWEMGTGKTKVTVETLRLLKAWGRFRRAVVVCPPVVIPTWCREVDKHSPGELSWYVWDKKGDLEAANRHDVVVLSYARARLEADAAPKGGSSRLLGIDYDVIVADESHSLGNFTSAQTKAVLQLSTKAARRYALTGTAADQPLKLYPQLRYLSPALMPLALHQFQERYLIRPQDPTRRFMVLGYKNMHELNARVDTAATRMKKAECLDLPPMTVIDVPFEIGVRQKARYNELIVTMQASLKPLLATGVDGKSRLAVMAQTPEAMREASGLSGVLMSLPHGAARVTKLLQLSSGFMINGPDPAICDACPSLNDCVRDEIKPYTPKCAVVQTPPPREVIRDVENPKKGLFETMVSSILAEDPTNKILCWGSFLPELDDMEEACRKNRWGYVRVDGSNTDRIGEIEDQFQKDADTRVYIGQVRSGVGITLTAANYTIYYALPWDRVQYRQSLERNNRPGQTRKMTVYRLLGKDTLDEFVAATLRLKDDVAYTLTEQITCAACPEQKRCVTENVRPFRAGCIHQAAVNRPVAKAEVIR